MVKCARPQQVSRYQGEEFGIFGRILPEMYRTRCVIVCPEKVFRVCDKQRRAEKLSSPGAEDTMHSPVS